MSIEDSDYGRQMERHGGGFLSSRAGWVAIGFSAIAGVLLFTEHRAHVLGVLIWLPLLACPLMHMFMHGGHRHGSHQHDSRQIQTNRGKGVS